MRESVIQMKTKGKEGNEAIRGLVIYSLLRSLSGVGMQPRDDAIEAGDPRRLNAILQIGISLAPAAQSLPRQALFAGASYLPIP
jgi:hypothetical protein